MRTGLVVAVLFAAATDLASSSLARADPAADAKAKFDHGYKLFQLGKYKEALPDFEGAFELDPNPAYLFAAAQAHRYLKEYDRAIELLTRYLEINPEPRPGKSDPPTDDVRAGIEALRADKLAADKAAADRAATDKAVADKALADKLAADKAEADRLAAEAAARKAAGENKHVRISVEAGVSLVHLQGHEETRSPSLGGRLGGFYTRRYGKNVFDVGGIWQITTLPFERTDAGHEMENTAVFFTQLHAYGAVTRMLFGPIWGRLGVGVGLSSFGNLKQGNPVTENMFDEKDIRMLCVRADSLMGYRYSSTIDFVLGIASASVSPRNKDLASDIKRTTTLEGFYLGVYIKI